MTQRTLDRRLLESLTDRFRLRLQEGLALARTDRFVRELEPSSSEEPDPIAELAAAFRAWRRALREGDADACLDAVEATWSRLEAYRRRVEERDAVVEAFRLRWAGENAAFSYPTLDSLARFYRLLPYSKSSQSKYEYVITRRLAGPLVPDRWLPPTEELVDAVVALEASWGGTSFRVDDGEAVTIALALKSFVHQALRHEDAAGFTASALLRRFGAFKAAIGQNLFDPRLTVAVVEANVGVFNVLNQLLTDAGGQPLRGAASVKRAPLPVPLRSRQGAAAPPEAGRADAGTEPEGASARIDALAPPVTQILPPPTVAEEVRNRPDLRTSEIDISGLELVRRRPPTPAPAPAGDEPALAVSEPSPEAAAPLAALDAPTPPHDSRPDLRTGEVDLSGLEFVRRIRRPKVDPSPEPEPKAAPSQEPPPDDLLSRAAGAAADAYSDDEDEGDDDFLGLAGAEERSGASAAESADTEIATTEQQPSSRAFELGEVEGNEAIIEQYLTRPRSPEVWRLNLDFFLAGSDDTAGGLRSADRRRALELILDADDLVCLRETQQGAPTAEHRARVKDLAQSMLRLQTALRRAAGLPQGERGELEPLLYVSDHLLWERLRLSASLRGNAVRRRPPLLPRTTRAAEAARRHTRVLRRHRRILIWAVGAAGALTIALGMLSASMPGASIDREVTVIRVEDFPEPRIFEDARAFRNRLFLTADLSWTRLGANERESIVRSMAEFAAGQGFDTLSVIGPNGEAWATFKDNEVTLASELVEPPGEEP